LRPPSALTFVACHCNGRFNQVSDDELLARLADLLGQARRVEAPLVAHIAEVEARHLYARFACTSMFQYCTSVLHLSESEAYYRIGVARATLEHPMLLEMLEDGRLHLSAIACLAPHLTPENREGVLARAVHKSKREIEELAAELAPRPDVPSVVRKLPDRSAAEVPRLTLASQEDSIAPPVRPVPPPPVRSSRYRRRGTRSSSAPGPSSARSSSGFAPSCARRSRTATSEPSSRRPST
jgi:hypothetical protein